MQILAAPIQEYTDAAFRNAHSRTIGSVDEYYTPFIRLENGMPSARSKNDIARTKESCATVVPQLLVKNAEETAILLDILAANGHNRADINLGCPFPKVIKDGYGAALLGNPDAVRKIVEKACSTQLKISIKMRLGLHDRNEWKNIMPVINDFPLEKVVLHPRTADELYNGTADKSAFVLLCQLCRHPVLFNGDIRTTEDAKGLHAIMLGRGLLANPLLPLQIRELPASNALLTAFHSAYAEECQRIYQQPLLKLKLIWDYFLPDADKRIRKAIKKARTLDEYLELTAQLLSPAQHP